MKEFLKDYGTLVGSFLGFLFAILVLFAKYYFDILTNRWSIKKKLRKLKKLIEENKPPEEIQRHAEFFNYQKHELSEVTKSLSISRLNIFKLQTYNDEIQVLKAFINRIEDDILKYTSTKTTGLFYETKNMVESINRQTSKAAEILEDIEEQCKNDPNKHLVIETFRFHLGTTKLYHKWLSDTINSIKI